MKLADTCYWFLRKFRVFNAMNILIPFVALKIYKYEMKCIKTLSTANTGVLYNFVKSSLITYQYIAKRTFKNTHIQKLFKKVFFVFVMHVCNANTSTNHM